MAMRPRARGPRYLPSSARNASAFRWNTFSSTSSSYPEVAPVTDQPLVAEERIVGPEHHPVLQAPTDLALQIVREVLRRPAVELVPDVGLVQQNGDHLRLPRPRRPRCEHLEVREAGRDLVEVSRVAVVEEDARPPGKPAPSPVVPTNTRAGTFASTHAW